MFKQIISNIKYVVGHINDTYKKAQIDPFKQELFKVTRDDECHYGFQYNDGLNTLKQKFNNNHNDSCCPGGLYFTTKDYISWYSGFGGNLREVTLPPDANYVSDGCKFRADKIILGNKYPLFDQETMVKFPFLCTTEYYYNGLVYASKKGNLEIFKNICEKGSIYPRLNVGFTGCNFDNSELEDVIRNCFDYACKEGHIDIVKYIANKSYINNQDMNKLLIRVINYESLDIVKYIIEKSELTEKQDLLNKGLYNCLKKEKSTQKTVDIIDYLIINGAIYDENIHLDKFHKKNEFYENPAKLS